SALLRGERHQGDFPGALDGVGQHPLVRGAGAGSAPGQDLAPLRDELAQPRGVLVVDVLDPLHAEVTDFPANALVLAGLLCRSWRHSGSFSTVLRRAHSSANGSLKSASMSPPES